MDYDGYITRYATPGVSYTDWEARLWPYAGYAKLSDLNIRQLRPWKGTIFHCAVSLNYTDGKTNYSYAQNDYLHDPTNTNPATKLLQSYSIIYLEP